MHIPIWAPSASYLGTSIIQCKYEVPETDTYPRYQSRTTLPNQPSQTPTGTECSTVHVNPITQYEVTDAPNDSWD
jgi:hypothetical protein